MAGIDVVGIGIGSLNIKRFFSQSIEIKNISDMPKLLLDMMKDRLVSIIGTKGR